MYHIYKVINEIEIEINKNVLNYNKFIIKPLLINCMLHDSGRGWKRIKRFPTSKNTHLELTKSDLIKFPDSKMTIHNYT